MSRHRDFRNLNIEDELDDDALSDGGEEEMTEEHHAQLIHGLEQVRQVLGGEVASAFSDKEIMDALWEYFFDEEKAIQWALEEHHRRQLARERKDIHRSCPDSYLGKALPPVPVDNDGSPSNAEYYHPQDFPYHDEGEHVERSRVPLVFLHQQHVPQETVDIEPTRVVRALSTITERTERTELTPRLPTGRMLNTRQTLRMPSTTFTGSSYGEVIEHTHQSIDTSAPMDPNLIPVSPSLSALNALSLFEPAPSMVESEEGSLTTVPHVPSESVPLSDGLPEIPDYNSKSSKQPPVPVPPPKKSKLALLASSRASNASFRSESSRFSGTALTGSVNTFPALRPSSHSARLVSSVPSQHPSSRLPSSHPGENEAYFAATSTGSSSMASHVRRAIETAMQLEAADKEVTPNKTSEPPSKQLSEHSVAASHSSIKSETPVRHPQAPSSLQSSLSPAHNLPSHAYKEVDTFRSPSKLALLAQAKTLANTRGPKVKRPVTEYLTPIANGPTATTAITTTYQTLYTLTDPTRSNVIPALDVIPLGAQPPSDAKRSKLVAKIKRAHERHNPPPVEEEVITPPVSPMFYPKPTGPVRAFPSAFASLLVDDPLTPSEDKNKDRSSRHRHKYRRHETEPLATSSIDGSQEEFKHKSWQHKHESPSIPNFSSPSGFRFDNPSPDDLVFNARRGTSLGKHVDSSSPTASRKAASPASMK